MAPSTAATAYQAKLDQAPTPAEIGRLKGKTGAGIALIALGVAAAAFGEHLPSMLQAFADDAAPFLLTAGAPLAGWGVIDKARKFAVLLRLVADQLDRLPRPPGT